jgi:homospermidine synthase
LHQPAILARLDGPLVLVGFGSIGKGVLPLILRHIEVSRELVTVIDPDDSARAIAESAGVRFLKTKLTRANLREQLFATAGARRLSRERLGRSLLAHPCDDAILSLHENAAALQVTSAVAAGIVWAIENPRRSVLEADDLDEERILGIMEPYLGSLVGRYTDWTPLTGRGELFPEDIDRDDPWQFRNTIVR